MNSYMANSKLFITDNNYQSYQSSTIKKGSLTRIKESKWAINFISKLIYWFNFLRIYFQKAINFISKLIYWFNFLRIYFQKTHLRAQARFLIGKRLVRLVIIVSSASEMRLH